MATARQTSNGSNPESDWEQGYGYQFWRCRHGAYRGDGAFGQFCIVMPEQDAVLAITSGVSDMQGVLNVTWDHLLPGLSGYASSTSTSRSTKGQEPSAAAGAAGTLAQKLTHLAVRLPEGSSTST